MTAVTASFDRPSVRARVARHWERTMIVIGICLPVPLLALTGLSIPLPATVERIAAALVPWVETSTVTTNEALEQGEGGTIVRSPGEPRDISPTAPTPQTAASNPRPAVEDATDPKAGGNGGRDDSPGGGGGSGGSGGTSGGSESSGSSGGSGSGSSGSSGSGGSGSGSGSGGTVGGVGGGVVGGVGDTVDDTVDDGTDTVDGVVDSTEDTVDDVEDTLGGILNGLGG
jgi:hypothetical protein